MTEPVSEEAYIALKEAIKKAIPDGDLTLKNLGTDPEAIENQIAENPEMEKSFAKEVQAGGGGGENGQKIAELIEKITDQIVNEADQETLEAMAGMAQEELEAMLEASVKGLV